MCVSVCLCVFPCVHGQPYIYMLHNTWNIMILYHEVFMYFLLGKGRGGRQGRGGEERGGEERGGEKGGGGEVR